MHRTAKNVKKVGRSSLMVQSTPAIDVVEEAEVAPDGQALDHVLRTFAGWLLSAARSNASLDAFGTANEVGNSLDVVRRAKVMSKGQ